MSPKRKRHREQKRQETKLATLDPESPAGKYRAFKARQISPELEEFQGLFDFPLDDFQIQGCQVLDSGKDVLVTAPTSAGKTIVGLYGIFLALRQGLRLFYTTPIKALSNQKFQELQERFGVDEVGLLTGDTVINGDADIVVMTTEVLRNMIYAGSDLLRLGFVVMDEVHYLSDHFRGPVWEEIIIHLDPSVRLISLSATVSNSRQFADWLSTLRGETVVVATDTRPVPLEHFMVTTNGEIFPLFEKGKVGGNINRALLAEAAHLLIPRRGRMPRRRRANRPQIARNLEKQGLLPAIEFIFSRVGCDAAAAELVRDGIRLTTDEEADLIRERVETSLSGFNPADLSAINVFDWEETLAAGVASHHAGLLPIQKQIVEGLFASGLIRLVFATETLALGINMPARTVVLESLNKFNGSDRVNLTPGEYTQLTGRAGRRGIDTNGYALTLLDQKNPPQVLSSLAAGRSYPLHSAFAPNYNMAVNLLARTSFEGAQRTVEKSFAQYEALGSSKKLLANLNKFEQTSLQERAAAKCHRGDIFELVEEMQTLTRAEKQAKQRKHSGENTPVNRDKDREKIDRIRARMKTHPCYTCSERDDHLNHARRALKAEEQASQTRKRIEMRTKSLARQLRSTVEVLQELNYVDANHHLTANGETLQGVYSERDLLVVECLQRGIFNPLNVAELAGALSVCVAENRGGGLSRLIPANSSPRLARALEEMARINFDLTNLQQAHYLEPYELLETGEAMGLVAWSAGKPLSDCLELNGGMGAGDFVRAVRQVMDLSDQLRKVAPTDLSQRFRQLNLSLKRGVVAWDF